MKNYKTIALIINLILIGFNFAQTPNGTLDFGTTANLTTATTTNTGFGGVRIGTGGGSFTIMNSGQEIGTGAELRGIAPTGTSINSVGITSTEFGTAANTFTISFEIYFSGGSSGSWYLLAGNGASTFGSAQSATYTSAELFTALRFDFVASNSITTYYRSGAGFSALSNTLFAQNISYTVTIVGNNSASTVNYGNGQSVAADKIDIWVNGVLQANDLAKGALANSININAFRFYGVSSTGNVATIALDNIKWWNSCVPPVMSLYSTVPSIPSNTYTDINVNSGDGSLAGDVIVNRELILSSGKVTLGSNNLTTSSISGGSSSSYVVTNGTGALIKSYSSTGSTTFPIGDASNYSPATINLTAADGFSSGNIAALVANSKYGNNNSTTNYINRYWTVTSSGITNPTYDATFTYVPGDVAGTEASLYGGKYSGSTWTVMNVVNSGTHSFSGTGLTSFSDFTAGEQSALPVELTSLYANMTENKVELIWQTKTEINNYGFEIQRCETKAVNSETWEKIGFVQGNGNSNSPKDYSFVDDNLSGGEKVSYRLKQIDNDGNYKYSDVVEISMNAVPTVYALYQNYPNPFNPTTNINYQIPTSGHVTLRIYDALGKEVATLVDEMKAAGSYLIQFNGEKFSSGIYFYSFRSESFSETRKFLLIK